MLTTHLLGFLVAACIAQHHRHHQHQALRQGRMTEQEMRLVHEQMNGISENELATMAVLPPPDSHMLHRESAPRCSLGSRSYCPGEILFRIGIRQESARICGDGGKFETRGVGAAYTEPKRCAHRGMEYCSGELLRGFTAWSFVQGCRDGRLHLVGMHRGEFQRAMSRFPGIQMP